MTREELLANIVSMCEQVESMTTLVPQVRRDVARALRLFFSQTNAPESIPIFALIGVLAFVPAYDAKVAPPPPDDEEVREMLGTYYDLTDLLAKRLGVEPKPPRK